jgi:hypothetical protein
MILVRRTLSSAGDLDLPRPLRAGLPLLLLGLLPLLAVTADLTSPIDGLALSGVCVVAALARVGWEARELARLRRAADVRLLQGVRADSSELVAWRAAELTSRGNRRPLAHSLRGLVRDLGDKTLPGASPLNRVGARPHVGLIEDLSARLAEDDRPVAPLGVVRVERLLTDGFGPLYARERAGDLGAELEHCLADLELSPVRRTDPQVETDATTNWRRS